MNSNQGFITTCKSLAIFIDNKLDGKAHISYICRKSIRGIIMIIKTGPQFNIKTTSYQYRKSHCGDKTILRPSYLHNGISYTGKMTSLYWIRTQVIIRITAVSWHCNNLLCIRILCTAIKYGALENQIRWMFWISHLNYAIIFHGISTWFDRLCGI